MSTPKKNLIIFPKGTLSKADRRALHLEGFLPIETDDPSKIVIPDFTPSVQTKDILLAVLDGLNSHAPHADAMKSLARRIKLNLRTREPTFNAVILPTPDPHAPLRERLRQLYEECESNFFGAWDSTPITDAIHALTPVAPAPQDGNQALRQALRENIISADIIQAEVIQAGVNRHGIWRDLDFIRDRSKAALSSAPATTGAEVGYCEALKLILDLTRQPYNYTTRIQILAKRALTNPVPQGAKEGAK